MRALGLVGLGVLVLAGAAQAQTPATRPPPAHAPAAAPPAGTSAAAPAPATITGSATGTIAPPPDEEGWTVVQLPTGYLRYRTEEAPPAGAEEEAGGVTIVPSTPVLSAQQPSRSQAPTGGAPLGGEVGRASNQQENAGPQAISEQPQQQPARCVQEQALLAQRLLELRGVFDIDPATALLALPSLDQPLSPYVQQAMFGMPTPTYFGGNLLTSALAWDQGTRVRAQALAACLMR